GRHDLPRLAARRVPGAHTPAGARRQGLAVAAEGERVDLVDAVERAQLVAVPVPELHRPVRAAAAEDLPVGAGGGRVDVAAVPAGDLQLLPRRAVPADDRRVV